VLRLKAAGVSGNEIARRVGVASSTVRLTLKRLANRPPADTQLCRTNGLAKRHPDTPSRDTRHDGSYGRGVLFRASPAGRFPQGISQVATLVQLRPGGNAPRALQYFRNSTGRTCACNGVRQSMTARRPLSAEGRIEGAAITPSRPRI
jgi:hypothetical protein